jgi:oligopeptide/dipeptide ABC transporter ATP-binding protein
MSTTPLLELVDIRKTYRLRAGLLARLLGREPAFDALSGITLTVSPGEVFGLVGESGSGKSTLGKIIARLLAPTAGNVVYRGEAVTALQGRALLPYRRRVQMIFQDSHSSLNPRKRIGRILGEALAARGVSRAQRGRETEHLLDIVGLGTFMLGRYPHELSGGQRQRISIARSLAMQPELLIADEPVSSLDVSLQGQIINLLMQLCRNLGLTLIFISHDLAVVKRICSRIMVIYAGRIVECGPPDTLLNAPAHPYTQALIEAVPKGLAGHDRRRAGWEALPSAAEAKSSGCPFLPRCARALAVCGSHFPQTMQLAADHTVACHFAAQAVSDPTKAAEQEG